MRKKIEYNCEVFKKYLVEYLDEDLPSEILIELEKHRLVCRECTRLIRTIRRIIYELRSLAHYELPEDVVSKVHASLRIKKWKRK
uniref:Zinc-finger domain-containing protein n=1 Tax=candidate division WOR-3 bacterium TaxID=2052148 RepID=A0A7V3ZUV3_UNCW3